MHSEGFEPPIPTIERLQKYALDRKANGIGNSDLYRHDIRIKFHKIQSTALNLLNLLKPTGYVMHQPV
jgi:hypothetical protein